ncbi:polyamine aminopropyltransferase [Nodosilinea sp. FACHB-131]|uniref:polyamine aminopropyltransferase n=1 Tax=Cyanophyceae TaxID=3028117 RepID=UPI00168A26D7|nr:polyamine aminopropyltransferase [Nodosilinea sp. FACHB-131]MBD1874516.1 polyamine aminopropyltransferase [Nodosilinea sp. FACHB-131]
MNSLGRHILVEFFGCSSDILNDVPLIESSMVGAAADAGATVISSVFHHFSPFGVSGVVVIQESHLAIHTWPEYRYAAVDLFTCGDTVNPWISFDKLKVAFKADYGSALEMNRGQLELLERIDVDLGELRDEITNKLVTPKQSRSVWFTDKNDDIALSIRHKGDRIFREKSPYQTVEIFDTFAYGKMLTIDNMVMCSEKDENAYHEMIIHVPMLLNPTFKNVLVIGGGDGGSVREILRHPQVEKVTMVEIDEAVVRASKEFLPSLSGALEDSKLDLRIEDGIAFVANAPDASYDLIVIDSSDPVGPSEGLFSTAFYQQVNRILKPGGAITAQSESPRFNQRAFVDIHHCLEGIFGDENVYCYLAFIPTYPTGMWSFNYATKGAAHPTQGMDAARSESFAAEHNLQYYNVGMHQAAFALPTFVQNMLKA